MTAYEKRVEHYCRGLESVNPGICAGCSNCQFDFGLSEDDPAWEELSDEGGFSWHQCDTCGSTLGGNRYAAHGFTDDDGTLVHLSMCEDCLMFFANGDLPALDDGSI